MDKSNRGSNHPLLRLALLLVTWTGFTTTCLAESTKVFRCTREDGHMEFRQIPCREGSQQELEIEDVMVGWEAPAATVELSKKRAKPKSRKTSASSRRNKEKQAKDCFKTEQRLENVNRKLRRGYKAGQGSDLRHQRRQYEAYLGRFCQ